VETKPYLFFYGRCEEALEFYKSVFGGSYEVMRNSDTPQEVQQMMGGADGNRVMHASFTANGVGFFASDGRDTKAIDPDAGNIAIAVNVDRADEGARLCAALAKGGKVQMEFSDAFWGGKFGNVVDRFGTEWMITSQ
jgi:PhnB protein